MASHESSKSDETVDPALASWAPVPPGSDFPDSKFTVRGTARSSRRFAPLRRDRRRALDLNVLGRGGHFDGIAPDARELVCAPLLGPLLAAGRPAWRAIRPQNFRVAACGRRCGRTRFGSRRASAAVRRRRILCSRRAGLRRFLFVAGTRDDVGKIFRPNGEPLLPNWRYVPIGYHGRTSTLVSSGTPIVRPHGQRKGADAVPEFGPTRALDFELELGFVTGDGPLPPRVSR